MGQKFYTVIKTRSLPIDLKSREFSYTGNGVIGRFYTGFTPQNLGAITPETFYCLRPKMPAFRDFDVYVLPAAPASLGARWNYDLVLEGPQQVQGKGNAGQQAGAGWIIDPNEEVLLEIESLDTQNISATILLFNGLLDLPL